MEMIHTIRGLKPEVRTQFFALCTVRGFAGCAKAVSDLGSSYLLLSLCKWDYVKVRSMICSPNRVAGLSQISCSLLSSDINPPPVEALQHHTESHCKYSSSSYTT